jgi:hypothetical protein
MTALLMTFTQNIMKETVMERHEIWLRLRRPALPLATLKMASVIRHHRNIGGRGEGRESQG